MEAFRETGAVNRSVITQTVGMIPTATPQHPLDLRHAHLHAGEDQMEVSRGMDGANPNATFQDVAMIQTVTHPPLQQGDQHEDPQQGELQEDPSPRNQAMDTSHHQTLVILL